MRLRFLIPALLCLAPSLRAADVQWPAKLGNWTASGAASSMPVEAGEQGAFAVLQESGLLTLSSRNYQDSAGVRQLRLYSYRDSSGAYEGYTFLRAMEASMNTMHTVILESNLVLWIDGKLSPDERTAAEAWEQSVSDKVPSPPIVGYLPTQGVEPTSERYVLGPVGFRDAATRLNRAPFVSLTDVVGFPSGAEAMFAECASGTQSAVLLLIEYPTPQLAELHLHHLQAAITASAKLAGTNIERKGSLLSIVLAPSSVAYADKLRNAVNYETQVTWNEASQTATDPPITSTLVKIIEATGVLMILAVVFGAAFGGVRVITKRFFPGKVFDRPQQMEVLQLGLSSKPIDPRDMY